MSGKTIDIRLKSGFDKTGVNAASESLAQFIRKLQESKKTLGEINAEMSRKMHALAKGVATDFGAAADKVAKGWGRVYETLDEINARIDAPRNAAREQDELNKSIERYCKACETARKRREEFLASLKKNPGSWILPSTPAPAQNEASSAPSLASVGKMAKSAIPAMMAIDRIAGSLDGDLGKVARGLQGVIGLRMAFGPTAAAIGAGFAAIEFAVNKYVEAQMKAIDKFNELTKRQEKHIQALKNSQYGKLANEIENVALAVEHASDMFERAAKKRMEFSKVGEGLNAAISETELLKMRHDMSVAVASADDESKGRVSAEWRVKMADKELELRKRAAESSAESERESLETAKERMAFAQKSLNRLSELENKAETQYRTVRNAYAANYEDGENDPEVQRYKAEYEKAHAKVLDAAKRYNQSRDDLELLQKQSVVNTVQRQNSIEEALNAAESAAQEAADERAKAEIKAAQDAARERERLDAELHKKRMDDLRAEIAAQKEATNPLRTVAAAAQSEFERAFAMYRDPSRAAAEIGEERDRADDLDRLHKDARRYGGKWRIDELSQLMAAGDTQGAQDRLAQWRRSASFTPEVEAMVRASAAEQTRTTAEDELRKLNDKTGELTSKLETLSQTRDAKLDGIERNTNQLATKVDELLSVKG